MGEWVVSMGVVLGDQRSAGGAEAKQLSGLFGEDFWSVHCQKYNVRKENKTRQDNGHTLGVRREKE